MWGGGAARAALPPRAFPEPAMNATWQRVEIDGKPADVLEPADGAAPRFGVLFLHGQDETTLAASPTYSQLLNELGMACICPHGRRCWWADRICAEFDPTSSVEHFVLEQVVTAVRERWQLGPRGLGLLGVCMGGQGALRLAFKHPDVFPVVAAIAPAIEY